MKVSKLLLSSMAISVLVACQPGGSLNEKEIQDFVTTHFAEKVGLDAAVEPFLEDLSDDLRVMNGMWGETSDYDHDAVKGEWFYEDSVTSEVYDINIEGGSATVMGSTSDYIAGIRSAKSRWMGLVVKENGKLVWKRFMWAPERVRAMDLVWPSVDSASARSAYGDMRYAMVNLRNSDGLRISDSLVSLYPDWASAHLGQLHYYILAGDRENLEKSLNAANSKFDGASKAEQTVISAYNPELTRSERTAMLAKALSFAGDDFHVRFWYTWGLEDTDDKIAVLERGLKRQPNSSVLNNMMAYVLMDRNEEGDLDQAEQHLKVYMTVHNEANSYDSMGDLLVKKGDKDGAKEMYLKAAEMHPDFAETSKEKAESL
jgi:tetratricopeptide (TPR) repeat protein